MLEKYDNCVPLQDIYTEETQTIYKLSLGLHTCKVLVLCSSSVLTININQFI